MDTLGKRSPISLNLVAGMDAAIDLTTATPLCLFQRSAGLGVDSAANHKVTFVKPLLLCMWKEVTPCCEHVSPMVAVEMQPCHTALSLCQELPVEGHHFVASNIHSRQVGEPFCLREATRRVRLGVELNEKSW